jgi:probable F420-dependent oxidoreductase
MGHNRDMRIGYVVPNSWGLDRMDEVIDLGVRAESMGADSLWVSHHLLHVGFVGERLGRRPYFDPLITLAILAGATSKSRLGTSVLVLPYLHPVSTAKTLATIEVVSEGRLTLGIGVGGLRIEHDQVGMVPWEQRGRYTDEFLDVLRTLWTPGPSSFNGKFFSLTDIEAYPTPVHSGGIPVVVGGHGPAAMRRAVTRGQGWHGLGVDPDTAGADRQALNRLLEAQGQDVGQFPFQVRLHVDVEDLDGGKWKELAAAYGSAGVDELVLAPQSGDRDLHLRWLDGILVPLTS